ncbi:STAS domain-containing protein [Streptomyces sp. NPDC050355]|uniref:Anti-sigma factor antagonist n=1 Tax=Streptomyces sirii TaxID=3127701 RepID=A0ABZ2QHD3_9ACTN
MNDAPHYPRLVGPRIAAGGTTVLELRGDLDILAVSVLSERLDGITRGDGVDLVVDLRGVTFIDCAGLSLLSRARHRTRQRGGRLRLTGVVEGGSVARLLRMTGLTGDFESVSGEALAQEAVASEAADQDPVAGSAGATDIAVA